MAREPHLPESLEVTGQVWTGQGKTQLPRDTFPRQPETPFAHRGSEGKRRTKAHILHSLTAARALDSGKEAGVSIPAYSDIQQVT